MLADIVDHVIGIDPDRDFLTALKDTRTSGRRTRPYRPQTNGKVERFHRTLNEEWAYASDWDNDTQRCDAHQHFMHYYNEWATGPTEPLKWDTPMATLTRLSGDNVLGGLLARYAQLGLLAR